MNKKEFKYGGMTFKDILNAFYTSGKNGDLIEFSLADKWIEKYADEIWKMRTEEINKELSEPYFGWCDVEGCDKEGCSGGNAWRDSGYWTVCYKHAQDYRDRKPQPKMKKASVKKESLRDKKTGYLPSIKE